MIFSFEINGKEVIAVEKLFSMNLCVFNLWEISRKTDQKFKSDKFYKNILSDYEEMLSDISDLSKKYIGNNHQSFEKISWLDFE